MEASNEGFGNRHFAPSALRMAGSLAPHEDLPLFSHGAPRLVILSERAGRARSEGSVADQRRTGDRSTRYLPRGKLLRVDNELFPKRLHFGSIVGIDR